VAVRRDEPPRTKVIRLGGPSSGYVCLKDFRTLVDKLCRVDLAVELWQTFPAERIKYVHDLLRAMRWLRERLQRGQTPTTPTDDQSQAVGTGNTASAVDSSASKLEDDGFYTHKALVEHFGLESEAFRKRLERWRPDHQDDWLQDTEAKQHAPQFLYRLRAVRPIIEAMKTSD
jgi:hypothetical protein